ncbi:MAG: elongation factor 1-alpha, partial [Thermoproteota archaeon]
MERVRGKERETGPVEYKLTLAGASERRIEELATQMEYRIREGGGEAFYEIGVSDEGELLGLPPQELEKTLEVLREVARRIGAELRVLREVEGKKGLVVEVHVRKVL